MLTISFLLYSFAVLTEYNLSHYKWMVSSEVDILNKNVNKIDFVFPSADYSTVRVAMKVPLKQ
jgi:hypothetical protein